MAAWTLVLSVFVFGVLILFHELGHFLVAKRTGIRVNEFGIGFGPRLAAVKRGETVYSLRFLPFGGFVRLAGVEPHDREERGFNRQPVGRRMLVIGAGPLMNFALAAMLFAVAAAAVGVPVYTGPEAIVGTQIGETVAGEPADRAGLRAGDVIRKVDGTPVDRWEDLVAIINASPGKTLELSVERNGRAFTARVTPRLDEARGVGVIGIVARVATRKLAPLQALAFGVSQTAWVVVFIVRSIVQMVLGRLAADIAGPVGMSQMIGHAARSGLGYLLRLAGVLSANLALLNLFPVPALDGSRLMFLTVEAVRGKPVDPEKEGFIHFVGFAIILAMIMMVTYRDILRLSSP